jgi:hypothetical protein
MPCAGTPLVLDKCEPGGYMQTCIYYWYNCHS